MAFDKFPTTLAAFVAIIFALASATIATQGAKSAKPTLQQEPRTDAFGDPLPEGALARLGTIRFRGSFGVSMLAFSPDGNTIAFSAAGAIENNVRLADVKTRRELRVLSKLFTVNSCGVGTT